MAFQKYDNLLEEVSELACRHLRSKAIFVTGQLEPSHADEEGSHYCWCNLTQHVLGPDDRDVCRQGCTQGRQCFKSQ